MKANEIRQLTLRTGFVRKDTTNHVNWRLRLSRRIPQTPEPTKDHIETKILLSLGQEWNLCVFFFEPYSISFSSYNLTKLLTGNFYLSTTKDFMRRNSGKNVPERHRQASQVAFPKLHPAILCEISSSTWSNNRRQLPQIKISSAFARSGGVTGWGGVFLSAS